MCFWVLAKGLMGERKMGEILLCLNICSNCLFSVI
nr:MAG TPA: hypothetical protein [Caudoviricetes sp.]